MLCDSWLQHEYHVFMGSTCLRAFTTLPESLAEIKERAKFLDNVDKIICKHIEESQLSEEKVSGQFSSFTDTRKSSLLIEIAKTTRKWFKEENSDEDIQCKSTSLGWLYMCRKTCGSFNEIWT